MQFWNIHKLKQRLASNQVSEGEAFAYFLAAIALETAGALIPSASHNMWDYIDSVVYWVIMALGTICCFYANGGTRGQRFFERYFALSWVLGIRWMVLFAIPAMLLFLLFLVLMSGVSEESTLGQTLFLATLEVVFFVRLTVHIGQVHQSPASHRSEE